MSYPIFMSLKEDIQPLCDWLAGQSYSQTEIEEVFSDLQLRIVPEGLTVYTVIGLTDKTYDFDSEHWNVQSFFSRKEAERWKDRCEKEYQALVDKWAPENVPYEESFTESDPSCSAYGERSVWYYIEKTKVKK